MVENNPEILGPVGRKIKRWHDAYFRIALNQEEKESTDLPMQVENLESALDSIPAPTGRGPEKLSLKGLVSNSFILSSGFIFAFGGLEFGYTVSEALYNSPPEALSTILPHLSRPGKDTPLIALGMLTGFMAGLAGWALSMRLIYRRSRS